MRVTIAQVAVTPDMQRNKDKILGVLASAAAGDWVTFPEGMPAYSARRCSTVARGTTEWSPSILWGRCGSTVMTGIRIGIQVCRELLFPEPWLRLRKAGARIVFHLNNALNPYDAVWRNVVITRAIEHGYYVCSTNNAGPPQELTSYLAAPFTGELLLEAERRTEQALRYDLPDEVPMSPY